MRMPIRKPGKYTNVKPDPLMTREKFDDLKFNLEKLKRNRPRAIEEVKRLAQDGDFSENAAYQIAKGRLRGINQRILEIEEHLKRAEIISVKKNLNKVSLGCHVTVETGSKTKTFLILGSSETDPIKNIISYNSPLGAGLMNKKTGDIIKIKLASREIEYKIIDIK